MYLSLSSMKYLFEDGVDHRESVAHRAAHAFWQYWGMARFNQACMLALTERADLAMDSLRDAVKMDETCTCMDEPQAGALVDGRLVTVQEKQLMVWDMPQDSALRNAQPIK